ISIIVQENKAVIKSGKSNFKLKGREISEYPTLKITKTNEVKVDSDIIRNLFQKSGYCVSKSETRPIFTGVNMSFDDGVVSVVSTDAHRLSKVIGGEFEGHGFEDSVTIPPKAIKEIPHLLSGETVDISRMDN